MDRPDEDVQVYLARIRKTIEKSRHLVSQAELRIAETDRMLEKQGLTREQVMAMQFSDAQIEAVNAELKRSGLDSLDEGFGGDAEPPAPQDSSSDAELEERQRKFGMMMKPFHI